mgnify:CR=1 FL=1
MAAYKDEQRGTWYVSFTIMTGLVRIAGKLRGDLRPNGKQQSGNGISV